MLEPNLIIPADDQKLLQCLLDHHGKLTPSPDSQHALSNLNNRICEILDNIIVNPSIFESGVRCHYCCSIIFLLRLRKSCYILRIRTLNSWVIGESRNISLLATENISLSYTFSVLNFLLSPRICCFQTAIYKRAQNLL